MVTFKKYFYNCHGYGTLSFIDQLSLVFENNLISLLYTLYKVIFKLIKVIFWIFQHANLSMNILMFPVFKYLTL